MTVNIKGLGKITANKDVLNWLSITLQEAGYSFEGRKNGLSKICKEQAHEIYMELDQKGYYDSVK